MNYQIPQPGETWTHRRLPEYMSAQVLEVGADTVVYIRRSVAGGSSHETQTASTIHKFTQTWQFSPEASSAAADTSGDGVADGATLHLVGDLPFDPPPSDMFGVPL